MIPSQFPTPMAIKPGLLQALALKAGQMVNATVVGPTSAGTTEVLVGRQQLMLSPESSPAPGTTLQLRVDMTSAGPRFVLVGQTPPQAPAAANLTSAQNPAPELAKGTLSQTMNQLLPLAASIQSQMPQAAATIIQRRPAELARPGTLQVQSLKPGQVFEARVLGTTSAGTTEVSVGKQQMTLPLPNNPAAGTILQLRVEATPVGPRLVVVAQTPPQPLATAAQAGQPTAQTGQPTGQPATVFAPLAQLGSPEVSSQLPGQIGSPQARAFGAPGQAPTAPTGQQQASGPQLGVQQPAMPQTEHGAMTHMVQVAAGRQDTTVPLMTSLMALAKTHAPLPGVIVRAIAEVLTSQTELSVPKLSGETVRNAVLRSGVFQEALLARGDPAGAPQGDVKSALLSLRTVLAGWLGQDRSVVVQHAPRQPPVRGAAPRGQRDQGDFATVTGTPEEIGEALLDRTESALSRLRLHQHASLPEQLGRPGAEWNLELPVTIAQQPNVMQMQISRDGGGNGGPEGERSWQMRFAINMGAIGEVGAQVGLRGRKTSVLLWAAEPETAATLREMLPSLATELAALGLEPTSISVRTGAPTPPVRESGSFVDATR